MQDSKEPFVSIGMPVYNGEVFLSERINSILDQTYSNFELIISDNCSTDMTQKICLINVEKDKRIMNLRQKNGINIISNFQYVLDKATGKYFVWASVDDFWEKDFLKENISFLEREREFVGSITNVDSFGASDQREVFSNKYIKKIIEKCRWSKYCPKEAVGNYEEKVKIYLGINSAQALYGIFRTDALKKSFVNESFLAVDLATILNVLKYGDFHIIQKKLIRFCREGFSSEGILASTKKLGHNKIGRIFPYYPFTKWCFSHIGKKIFFSNILHFIKLNTTGGLAIIYDLLYSKKNN